MEQVREPMEDQEYRRCAKARLIAQMQRGYSYQAAIALSEIPVSQSTAYRLSQAVRKRGGGGIARWTARSSHQAPWSSTSIS